MVNGPLGGNMGTPPVPPQPPQVSFETTAQSRGNFNNFLKSMPNTTAMTPLPPMGSPSMMPAPNPMGNIDIFNEPMGMQFGGVAGNPLSGYGDYLSQQIDNTQVEPFIQEVEQMANDRFNLSGGSDGLPQIGDGRPEPINNRLPQLGIFQPPPLQAEMGQPMMQRPAAPFQMQGLAQPMRDKDGILREPMGLRGGPEMFNLDQQIFNDGIMPGNTYLTGSRQFESAKPLMGSLPRTYFDGGDVQNFQFGGFADDTVGDTSAGDFSVGDTEDRSESDDFKDALDQAIDQASQFGDGQDSINVFADDPAVVDRRGINVGLENTGGFTTGVVPNLRGERFTRFETPDYALRALGRDFRTKMGRNPDLTVGDYFETFTPSSENPGGTGDRVAEFTRATGKGAGDPLSLNDMGNIMDIQYKFETGQGNTPAERIQQVSTTVPLNNDAVIADLLGNINLDTAFKQEKVAPNIPDVFSPNASDFANFQSTRDQLPPSVARDTVTDRDADALSNIAERNQDRATGFANRNLEVDVNTTTGRPEIAPTVDNLLRLGREAQANKQDAQAASQSLGVGTPLSVQGPPKLPDQVFDIETILPEDDILTTISPEVLSSISREQRVDDANTFRSSVPDEAKIFGGRQVSNLPIGFPDPNINDREDTLGVLPEGLMTKIEELDRRKPTFSGGIMDKFPSFVGSGLNFAENMAKPFIMEDLVSGNFEPIYDSQGRITGSRNPRTGAVQSGMDFNAPMDTGDDNNENPFILKPKAKEEEKEEEDKPPNVIGGGDIPAPPAPKPVVVDSPFTSNVGDFVPASFNTGELNKLIEALTGISAPKSMKQGGVAVYAEGGRVMQALDNLLATG